MTSNVYNLFLDSVEEFSILGYDFKRIETYDSKDKQRQKETGEHILTFKATFDGEEKPSFFYYDAQQLDDIILFMRFFTGDFICSERICKISWSKYNTPGPLERKELFKNKIIPYIEFIFSWLSEGIIKERKLDTLLFLYDEYFKNQYFDIQLALMSPLLNILIDLYEKKYPIPDKNTEELQPLYDLRSKIEADCSYNEDERSSITLALYKLIEEKSPSLTEKTVNFIKNVFIMRDLDGLIKFEQIDLVAKQINALRNGVVHAGSIDSSSIEKKFKKSKLESDEDSFQSKLRVQIFAEILMSAAILELLNIVDYDYKVHDTNDIKEFFSIGTIREN